MGGTSIVSILNKIFESIVSDGVLDNTNPIKQNGSVISLMKNFIITPNVIISERLKYMDEGDLKAVIKKEVSVFAAIVVDAIRLMANVYNLSPSVAIGVVNDRRSLPIVGNEAVDYWKDLKENEFLFVGYEAISGNDVNVTNKDVAKVIDISKDIDLHTTKYEVQLTVTTPKGDTKVIVIPIYVQPRIFTAPTQTLIDGLIDNTYDKSFLARLDEWRAGAISFLDFILATDLVKEYKNKRLKSESDIVKLIKNKVSSSTVKSLLAGKARFDSRYNIYNFDVSEKAEFDRVLKGDVYKTKYMQALIDDLYAFSISFIDQEKQRLIYLTELNTKPSVLPLKFIKNEKQNDISDIIANLVSGRPPF